MTPNFFSGNDDLLIPHFEKILDQEYLDTHVKSALSYQKSDQLQSQSQDRKKEVTLMVCEAKNHEFANLIIALFLYLLGSLLYIMYLQRGTQVPTNWPQHAMKVLADPKGQCCYYNHLDWPNWNLLLQPDISWKNRLVLFGLLLVTQRSHFLF